VAKLRDNGYQDAVEGLQAASAIIKSTLHDQKENNTIIIGLSIEIKTVKEKLDLVHRLLTEGKDCIQTRLAIAEDNLETLDEKFSLLERDYKDKMEEIQLNTKDIEKDIVKIDGSMAKDLRMREKSDLLKQDRQHGRWQVYVALISALGAVIMGILNLVLK
jgi:hypothetical protein